jgi:single-strand DNA-binding protein
MNKIILVGRLSQEPELMQTTTGISKCTFNIAVNRNFTNQEGEREADFFRVVTWRGLAENVAKYCAKGKQVAVEGRLQNRTYEAEDGTTRYVTEVIAENVEFLGSTGTSNPQDTQDIEEAAKEVFGDDTNIIIDNGTPAADNNLLD